MKERMSLLELLAWGAALVLFALAAMFVGMLAIR
jgi:hypothetical protein